jgi:uncharacterized protein (DUF2236 family)
MKARPIPKPQTVVDSSAIKSVHYDRLNRTLQIWFHTGSIYDFYKVSAQRFNALLTSESQGKYFNAHIRDEYRWRRVK